MRVNSVPPLAVNLGTEKIAEKDDPTQQERSRRDQPDTGQGRDSDRRQPSKEPTEQEVLRAMEELGSELRAGHTDLQAEQGSGPGLRVVLKDGKGAIVRQMTGEEFLRLRTKIQPSGKGRLLDKKL